jgi:hypothetical protein
MATTKITNPDLFDIGSLDSALRLPSGTEAQRPASPSTGEWRYNTDSNTIEFWDGIKWRTLSDQDIPPTPSEHFNTVTYTGNGTAQSITGVGFQPDFVWIKARNVTYDHAITDSTRGVTHPVYIGTGAQLTNSTFITSFDADGFSIGNNAVVNNNTNTYVAWCWKANGGTTSSNTDGTITSTVQANTKAGFSIVKYTGNGSASATVGHGLGSIPELTIFKQLDSGGTGGGAWNTYLTSNNTVGFLNANTGFVANNGGTNGSVDIANMSSTTFGFLNGSSSANNQNNSGSDYIVYAFTSIASYSKIGSYTGNGVPDGPLVVTGFEPALLIVKKTNSTANWRMVDNKRNPLNHRQRTLFPNLNNAEDNVTGDAVDFLSTGFKISNDDNSWNQNGDEFLYIAFASDPTAAPTLADSFANKLYTGNATSNRAITGLGFSPSWVWIKNRSSARDHMEFDNVRLLGSELVPGNYTNLDAADFNTTGNDFNSFDTDGFTVGQDPYTNENGSNMVAWCWKANPIPAINNDGDIQSIVSANQAAGFSIVTYTGNSTAGSTVGHGLSSAPDAVIIKCMNTFSTNWINYYETIGNSDYLTLNLSNSVDTFSNWFYSNATNFTLNQTFGNANTSGRTYVAYCFKSTPGFSKMGSYTGNSSTQAITGLGFSPNWVLLKETDGVDSWELYDTARGATKVLYPNGANAEGVNSGLTSFDSDGFTLGSATSANESGKTYIYMAFKENPAQYPIASGYMGYLVVAGGGGAGASDGGGAGAGGLRTSYGLTSGGGSSAESDITLAAGTYTITVGAGGTGAVGYSTTTPTSGGNSSIAASGLTTITSTGGGRGGMYNHVNGAPEVGGSGGGSGGESNASNNPAAGTANQGFAGGQYTGSNFHGGGGGGASEAGNTDAAGEGGDGLSVAITGSAVAYAGGGAGGGIGGTTTGGTGGGGNSAVGAGDVSGSAGSTNTGGGGGAGGDGGSSQGGAGGSGVVILRMNTSDYSGSTTGSPTVTTSGSETIITYTGSGTYVHS